MKNSNSAKWLQIRRISYLFENKNIQCMQISYITQKKQRTVLDNLKEPYFNFNLRKVYLLHYRQQVHKEFILKLKKLENCI